jgi:AraC family transcriptional regulator, transcriptional activator of pobA
MRHASRRIPSFTLYGEHASSGHTDALHIEAIQARSRKYLWKIATHRHATLAQCLFVAAGPVTARLEDLRFDLQGPAVIIVPAGSVHEFGFGADTQGHVLTTDLERLLNAAAPTQQHPILRLFAEPRAASLRGDAALATRVSQQIQVLAEEFCQPDSSHTPICTWLASSVLAVLANSLNIEFAAESRGGRESKQFGDFKALIESHYSKHWPISRFAARLAMSETSLNRLCRALCGTTAFHLVQQRLALEARRRLMYVTGSVHSIASELGFADAAYFSRFFRRQTGVSPNQFRRQSGG